MLSNLIGRFADINSCDPTSGGLFGFPHWYKYLPGIRDANGLCIPQIQSISDFWLILAAIIDMLLRVAALLAIGFIVWAGIRYIVSQGDPEQTKNARNTIWDAIIGLVIAIVAITAVNFVAGKFNG